MQDERIVELYLKRDSDAIRVTKELYGEALKGIVYRILDDHGIAEECENDTYLALWESIPPHEPKDHFFAFAARIARNLALDRYRSEHRQKRQATMVELTKEMEECLPGGEDASRYLEQRELAAAMNVFLKNLPEEQRMLFLRRYWYADPVKDLSRRFGWSESKIKSILHRIRKKLKMYLEQEGLL